MRRYSKTISVGGLTMGGKAPVRIQSMTTTFTEDVINTAHQINALAAVGCEIVRLAVPTMQAAEAIAELKKMTNLPIVADIHFDYRLALAAVAAGVDKVRINPGNIGSERRVSQVIDALKERQIPLRIGVNSGSLEPSLLQKYAGPTAQAMVESALKHVAIVEKHRYDQMAISIKSSSVVDTVMAYRLLADKVDYPLHLGVTEVGTFYNASVKSAMGIGTLLIDGIGDTLRVSITGDPLQEIKVAKSILSAAEVRQFGLQIVACPTCGRCHINLAGIVEEIEQKFAHIDKPLKLAVMGCAVNGPGEAREADLGLAGGKQGAVLFKRGKIVKKVAYEGLIEALSEMIEDWSE